MKKIYLGLFVRNIVIFGQFDVLCSRCGIVYRCSY